MIWCCVMQKMLRLSRTRTIIIIIIIGSLNFAANQKVGVFFLVGRKTNTK